MQQGSTSGSSSSPPLIAAGATGERRLATPWVWA
jgi:hypothetical protein